MSKTDKMNCFRGWFLSLFPYDSYFWILSLLPVGDYIYTWFIKALINKPGLSVLIVELQKDYKKEPGSTPWVFLDISEPWCNQHSCLLQAMLPAEPPILWVNRSLGVQPCTPMKPSPRQMDLFSHQGHHKLLIYGIFSPITFINGKTSNWFNI